MMMRCNARYRIGWSSDWSSILLSGCHRARVAGPSQQPPCLVGRLHPPTSSGFEAGTFHGRLGRRPGVDPPPPLPPLSGIEISEQPCKDASQLTRYPQLTAHSQLNPPPFRISAVFSPTMLRQAFSTSSRALRSAPRLAASQPLLRTQFQRAPAAWLSRAAQPAVARWYSDAKEAPAEGEKAEKAEAKEEAGETDAVAELKKSLEAKDAEARDWKVKSMMAQPQTHRLHFLLDNISQF